MKANFVRIPISRWNEDEKLHLPSAGAVEIQVGKVSGKTEDYYLVPAGKRLEAAQRLVVLIPPGKFDEHELAMKVGRLGQWGQKNILLVGLASDPLGDNLLRRRMNNVSSWLHARFGDIACKLLFKPDWFEALRELLKEDDRVICLENHCTTDRFLRNVGLAQRLTMTVNIPVCVLQGLHLEVEEERRWGAVREFLTWVSMALTVIFFLMLQVWIQQTQPGTQGVIFQIASVVIEGFVIFQLNQGV